MQPGYLPAFYAERPMAFCPYFTIGLALLSLYDKSIIIILTTY